MENINIQNGQENFLSGTGALHFEISDPTLKWTLFLLAHAQHYYKFE